MILHNKASALCPSPLLHSFLPQSLAPLLEHMILFHKASALCLSRLLQSCLSQDLAPLLEHMILLNKASALFLSCLLQSCLPQDLAPLLEHMGEEEGKACISIKASSLIQTGRCHGGASSRQPIHAGFSSCEVP